MNLNSRMTSSAVLGLLLFIGCGEDPPFSEPPGQPGEAGEPQSGGSGGAAPRDAGGSRGTGSARGSGGAPARRDAGRGGSGATTNEGGGGVSGANGSAGAGAREGGVGTGGTGGAAGTAGVSGRDAGPAHVVINEIVADPQRDWNDTAGGNAPFDATPGTGTVSGADEWIELLNASGAIVDLSGWTLVMTDGTPATQLIGTGDAVLSFSSGGALAAFQADEYLVVGNPKGDLNNTVTVELRDAQGLLVDRVALGGDGGGPSGNATGSDDEAIARVPNGTDTDDDAADLSARPPTPGAPN
jgi:hypothetical protein